MPPVTTDADARVLVLCPMGVERRAVTRALRAAGLHAVRVVQTGVGKDAVRHALARGVPDTSTPSLAILAGLCGALVPVDDLPRISRVIDESGGSWTPADADPNGVAIIGADRIISTPADKHSLAQTTGASIVDMEADAFAAACESRGIPWSIVRGVSDTPDETLPPQVLNWITPAGDSRPIRAALDMLLRPRLIPHVLGFVRRSNRVLPAVGARVVDIIRARESGVSATGRPAPDARTRRSPALAHGVR